MTTSMEPTPGPVTNTTYQPGTPGAQWTDDEVMATRLRVLQMIHPNWDVKKAQGTWNGIGTTIEKVIQLNLITSIIHFILSGTNN